MSSVHPDSVWISALRHQGHGRCGHDYSPLALVSSYAPIRHGPLRSRSRALSVGTIHAIRRGILDLRLNMMLWRCIHRSPP